MAEVVRYLNTLSTPGGNGTTNSTTGANRAYASLNEWESNEQTDLVSDGDTHLVHCEGSSTDTTAVIIDGWGTSATCYIIVQVDENVRHQGILSTDYYMLDIAAGDPCLSVYEECKIFGLQVRNTQDSHFQHGVRFHTDVAMLEFAYNIVCLTGGNYVGSGLILIPFCTFSSTYYVYNNIVYGEAIYNHTGNCGMSLTTHGNTNTWDVAVYNNTVDGFAYCYRFIDSNVTITAFNNISNGASQSNVYIESAEGSSNNNASSDATNFTDGGNNRDNQVFTFAGSGDYHLSANDKGALGFGTTDPGGGLFDDDIDGQTRTGDWDIGADQHVSPRSNIVLNVI